jgi:hypothetical protein
MKRERQVQRDLHLSCARFQGCNIAVQLINLIVQVPKSLVCNLRHLSQLHVKVSEVLHACTKLDFMGMISCKMLTSVSQGVVAPILVLNSALLTATRPKFNLFPS